MKERYTFAEVARKLDVSLSSVWRWHLYGVKHRKLKSVMLGGRRYVTASQLAEFCNPEGSQEVSEQQRRLAKAKLNARRV